MVAVFVEEVCHPSIAGFQAQKRRPKTSLDVEVVGRGNLNSFNKLLIYKINNYLYFWLEYCTPFEHPLVVRSSFSRAIASQCSRYRVGQQNCAHGLDDSVSGH